MTETLSLETKPETVKTSPASVLRIRNFRLLWIGEGISLLGDQFYLIALPWLVLSLTGNALAVGTVMAMAGIDVHVENDPKFDFSTLRTWTMNPKGAGNAVRIISADDNDSTQLKKNWETKILPIVQEGFGLRTLI